MWVTIVSDYNQSQCWHWKYCETSDTDGQFLSLAYVLFSMPDMEKNTFSGSSEHMSVIEDYLEEYCSETLCQLSMQNSSNV